MAEVAGGIDQSRDQRPTRHDVAGPEVAMQQRRRRMRRQPVAETHRKDLDPSSDFPRAVRAARQQPPFRPEGRPVRGRRIRDGYGPEAMIAPPAIRGPGRRMQTREHPAQIAPRSARAVVRPEILENQRVLGHRHHTRRRHTGPRKGQQHLRLRPAARPGFRDQTAAVGSTETHHLREVATVQTPGPDDRDTKQTGSPIAQSFQVGSPPSELQHRTLTRDNGSCQAGRRAPRM